MGWFSELDIALRNGELTPEQVDDLLLAEARMIEDIPDEEPGASSDEVADAA